MPKKAIHNCVLAIKDTSGLPKLHYAAGWIPRLRRSVRNKFLLNPNHFKCKYLFRSKSAILAERKRHATSKYSFIIHPLSSLNVALEALFGITLFLAIFAETIIIFTFDTIPLLKFCDKVLFPIRMALIIFIFITGYIEQNTKHIIIEPSKIIRRYLKTFFIFDFFSTRFLDIVLTRCDLIDQKGSLYLLGVRILALCTRIPTLLRFTENILHFLRIKKTLRFLVLLLIKTFIYLHLLTCVVYFVADQTIIKSYGNLDLLTMEQSWLYKTHLKHKPPENHWYYEFWNAFYVVMTFFFGLSHRYEVTLLHEQMSIVIVSFTGRLYTLYVIADILNIFGIIGFSESMYDRNLAMLNEYMMSKNLPGGMRQRMIHFYEFKFQRRYFREKEILKTLSQDLCTELFLFSANKMIHKVDIFKKLPSSLLAQIIAVMTSEMYSPNDVIIDIGDNGDEVYFISSGCVAVLNDKGLELLHLTDGDVFGIIRILLHNMPYCMIAVETTEVFIINRNQLLEFLSPYPELMNALSQMTNRLLAKLKVTERMAAMHKRDVLSDLKKDRVLEKPRRRPYM